MNAIDVVNLSKTYPRTLSSSSFEALKGISFQVEVGEAFGFIGPNGAGKSTTIRILTGAMRQSGGEAFLFGKHLALPCSRKGLGYVPETSSLPDYLTPLEILQMSRRLHALDPNDGCCMGWLDRFGIAPVAKKIVKGFSKGMAQRTALANAMAVSPRLLILDEPLSGLDPIGRRDVVDVLSEYCRGGGTLFFTSHVLHDVERLAHRYGLIHQGKLMAVRSPAELTGATEKVTVRTIGSAKVEGFSEEAPQRWYAEISRHELWLFLQRAEQAGHTLTEVRPFLSLETAFMQVVRGT